ncbi:MAG: response regulator [Acidobacteriota bacterium]|nr:response regulator [Blastocatellia bacterium]MDW8411391.1 response regulator [Acidobacteriota bacterium]
MARILIIDDEDEVRMAGRLALELGGHEVMEANGGIMAMKMLKDHGAFDLIISDVMMPGIGGLEVCQLVRLDPAFKNIPFIFLSGKREDEERLAGMDVGADDYVGKPFSVQELLLRVNSVLRRHKKGTIGLVPTPSNPLIQLTLPQLIEMIVRHSLSGKLSTMSRPNEKGVIFFEGGHAVHAKFGNKLGEQAVREIMSSALLFFSFEAYEVADQITMAMDISRMIKR